MFGTLFGQSSGAASSPTDAASTTKPENAEAIEATVVEADRAGASPEGCDLPPATTTATQPDVAEPTAAEKELARARYFGLSPKPPTWEVPLEAKRDEASIPKQASRLDEVDPAKPVERTRTSALVTSLEEQAEKQNTKNDEAAMATWFGNFFGISTTPVQSQQVVTAAASTASDFVTPARDVEVRSNQADANSDISDKSSLPDVGDSEIAPDGSGDADDSKIASESIEGLEDVANVDDLELGAEAATFDSEKRHLGVVNFFSKLKGYGFITLHEKGVVPNDVIFVHWQSIASNDRFAFLQKGDEMEFSIQILKGGGLIHRAKNVTEPGGEPVKIQDTVDDELKTFLGGKDLRYTGWLKFYDPKMGYGYITLDDDYNLAHEVKGELRVERAEVNCEGQQPVWMARQHVEFGIWATAKGAYKAYNMTLKGGIPLTQAALENRVRQGDEVSYKGSIKVWNWKQGWGFIKVAPGTILPENVCEKLQAQAKDAQKKAVLKGGDEGPQEELLYFRKSDIARGNRMERGAQVTFEVYTDDKGAGAQQVRNAVAP